MTTMKRSPVKGEQPAAEKKVRGVKVRLISGDHLNTAIHVAQRTGILTENDDVNSGAVMTGE